MAITCTTQRRGWHLARYVRAPINTLRGIVRADRDIRREVELKLDSDPKIGARDIAVSVRQGVVMFAGFLRSRGERARAEVDAMKVVDIVGLANDIEVRLPLLSRKTDLEIAREVIGCISTATPTLEGRVCVRVADGEVTLEGEAESHDERMRAEAVAGRVKGAGSIRNDIRLAPRSALRFIRVACACTTSPVSTRDDGHAPS